MRENTVLHIVRQYKHTEENQGVAHLARPEAKQTICGVYLRPDAVREGVVPAGGTAEVKRPCTRCAATFRRGDY